MELTAAPLWGCGIRPSPEGDVAAMFVAFLFITAFQSEHIREAVRKVFVLEVVHDWKVTIHVWEHPKEYF